MKILLMSDTHGELKTARSILQEHAAADLKIHLGMSAFRYGKSTNAPL